MKTAAAASARGMPSLAATAAAMAATAAFPESEEVALTSCEVGRMSSCSASAI